MRVAVKWRQQHCCRTKDARLSPCLRVCHLTSSQALRTFSPSYFCFIVLMAHLFCLVAVPNLRTEVLLPCRPCLNLACHRGVPVLPKGAQRLARAGPSGLLYHWPAREHTQTHTRLASRLVANTMSLAYFGHSSFLVPFPTEHFLCFLVKNILHCTRNY